MKVEATDYTFRRQPSWRYWVVPLAVLAFWSPDKPWDFNPIYFLTSDAPLAFCLMTPVYLSILYLIHPRVNLPALRVTSFIGAMIGVFNIVYSIGSMVGFMRWCSESLCLYLGFLHTPLLTLSLCCFTLSIREKGHIVTLASNGIYRLHR